MDKEGGTMVKIHYNEGSMCRVVVANFVYRYYKLSRAM
jgi:hypothetical protein